MDDDLDLESLEDDDSSKSRSSSPQHEEMSWEVLDCSDSDSQPVSDTTLTPLSKQPSDAGDWVLQPDTDRDVEAEDTCLPIIQSITSLSSVDDDKTEAVQEKETRSGHSRLEDHNLSEDDSDRLIIDTSATTTDLETSANSDVNAAKGATDNSEKDVESSTAAQYTEAASKSPTAPAQENGVENNEQSENSDDKSTNNNEQPGDEEEENGHSDDGFNLVISAVQGNVASNSKTAEDCSETNDTATSAPISEDTIPSPSTNGCSGEGATTVPASTMEDEPKKNLIVIDPDGSSDGLDNLEYIQFKPGIIKLEADVPTSGATTSATKPTAKSNAPIVLTFPANSNIATQASLCGGTTLSTATMQQAGMVPVHSTSNMNIAYQAFQQQYQFGSRTILKSPPRKSGPGPIPQVLVRHAGPRSRPAYIRLGSQTLQQFARMSGPNQGGMQTNQQRMISVLMDRGSGVTTSNTLPHNFSQLLQAGPPGTLVSTGGPGGNPVKVLILPSQSNNASPITQSNVTNTVPPMYSVTTSGSIGALTSVGNLMGSKGNTTTLSSTPELKSASQIMAPSATSKGTGSKSQGSGKSKSQSSSSKSGGAKGQSGGKSSKASSKESAAGDTDSLLQNLTSTEERLKRRLLSKTNLIKEYHPSLTSGLGHISFEFYSCHGCRDVFVNKSSLEYHRNRQSMCITYNCDPCKHTFTFPNKCQFRCHMLKHVQELKLIHKNLLDRITVKPTQYSASKSKGQQRDASPSVEDIDIASVHSPVDVSAPKELSPLTLDTNSLPEKDTDKVSEAPEGMDNGSTLGLTIASVSSVSLGDHQEVPMAPPLMSPIKATIAQPQFSQPPPLTLASIVPTIAAPPPHVTPALSIQPRTITLDLTQMGPAVNPMGPLAQTKPDRAKPETKLSAPVETRPDLDVQQIQSGASPTAKALPPPVQSTDGGNIFCTECSLTFSSYMKLQRHYNDADKPHPLRPPCCNVRLATECCVRAHMRTHQQQRPYVCSDCGECFRGELAIFRKHTYNCKRVMHSAVIVFPCPRCQSWFSKIDELRGHVRKVHSESYLKCNLCPMAFKSIASFSEHNTNKHPGEKTDSANFTSIYKCPLCDSVFHDQRMKLDHLEQHINNIYANQRVSFVCQLCKKLCYNYAMMRYHLKEKHMVTALGNMCDLCGVDAGPTIKHLVAHQRKIHNSFPANMLIDPFTKSIDEKGSDNETTLGMKTPTKSDGDIIPLESGNGAGATATAENEAKVDEDGEGAYHGNLQRASSMYNQTESKPGENGEGEVVEGTQVRCHICHQKFSNRKDLVRHKKVDHGMMKRKRIKGDKSPEEEPKKIKHDEDLLDETTPQFQVSSNYMLRFECDDCDYRTPTFQELQQHQASAHGIEARFPCLLCGITFHSMGTLDDHMKCTHEGQIRAYPYLCWICVDNGQRKGYSKRAHLVRHFMNYHKVASKAIDGDRLDEMDRKAEMSDAEKLKADGDMKMKPPKRPRVEGEDSFACIKCDFECKDRQEFQDHIVKHKKGGADSFQCPDCGMCFSVLPPLKNHLRLVHKVKNFNEYVEKSGVKLKEAEKSKTPTKKTPVAADTSPTDKNPLECTVCYRAYQDPTSLKNHMRSHGMAFIKSKRLAPLAFLAD